VPPIDVAALIRSYADLHIVPLPFDFDGLCIDLKVPGRRPKVIVNSTRSDERVRFTLAHELGHLLIPWHVGSIVDRTAMERAEEDYDYWFLEAEANRFASELLMPSAWVSEIAAACDSPLEALSRVRVEARTSKQAATLKLIQCMPPNYVMAQTIDGIIVTSQSSPGTAADVPPKGSLLGSDPYPYATGRWRTSNYYWWSLAVRDAPVPRDAAGVWRQVLDQILEDCGVTDAEEKRALKASINGIVASVNNPTRRGSAGAIYAAGLQRLYARATDDPRIAALLKHPLRDEFLALRIAEFVARTS